MPAIETAIFGPAPVRYARKAKRECRFAAAEMHGRDANKDGCSRFVSGMIGDAMQWRIA